MNIERVESVGRPLGILHCPACGARLGRSDSPHVGYLTRCALCDVRLTVHVDGTRIFVSVKA